MTGFTPRHGLFYFCLNNNNTENHLIALVPSDGFLF